MARIFCIGDVNTDLFLYTDETPVPGTEKGVGEINTTIGGNAANTAMALGHLGADVTLISATGKDTAADFIKKELKKAKVKTIFLPSKKPTGTSVIFVTKTGERGIMSNKGALLDISIKAILNVLPNGLRKQDIIYFGGYYHLPQVRKGFEKLLEKIKVKETKIFFDTTYDEYGKWEVKKILPKTNIFFTNTTELEKITKKRNIDSAAKWLIKNGAKKVVVKKGKHGAAYYAKNEKIEDNAISSHAVNSTGAGDFFTAGFTYAKSKLWGNKTCLVCGNFIAGKKIQSKEYYEPKIQELELHLKKTNLAQLKKINNKKQIEMEIVQNLKCQLKMKKNSVLALASGHTPIGVYKEIAKQYRAGKIDFSEAYFLELDEYLNTKKSNTFKEYFKNNLLSKVNFKKNRIIMFDSETNWLEQKKKIEKFIHSHSIDLMLLGIGKNGHLAFNEPGTGFESKIHIAKLTKTTIKSNKKELSGKIPKEAITLGLKTIVESKKIIVTATGKSKAIAVKKATKEKATESVPASILQKHRNAIFIVDKAAGKFV
ncbi:MAG: hypothetical protein COV47_00635 [Candidatus Diapherotrites archaeon CG11_big_fil_rev_8_21_14_0_20_37_9]|nr:MAG: hypothetical protein COV47_00635 [Candidatus Diapherotrites archaeon CG11_big_fil_rev_8_21_14_0_20_37_9]